MLAQRSQGQRQLCKFSIVVTAYVEKIGIANIFAKWKKTKITFVNHKNVFIVSKKQHNNCTITAQNCRISNNNNYMRIIMYHLL